ncbi:integrase [Anaerosolibacter carboniphilus]|uniref:Integrase n=1 Tax=Anaerosolibacter carboniphilus TaxID=1417629 RepID=A0A841KX68_9FIRM|nr:site-specific integrase [Anaerosolibacter carboniphilus]MBB6218224.1 integrase [Anaerosolibacter carboniphilus]
MPNKRGQGEGSIRKRGDGTWEARYTIGKDENGKQIRKSVYGHGRQEVAQKLTKILNEINSGLYVEPTKMTVNDWLNTWLKEYKMPSLKAKTYDSYAHTIDYFIRPIIGHIVLKDLRPDQVQSMLNEIKNRLPVRTSVAISKLEEELKGSTTPKQKKVITAQIEALKDDKISSRTVKYVHIILNGALKQALKNNLVVRNVCEAVNVPKKDDKKEIKVLTIDSQKKFLDAIKGHRLEAAFMLNISTGVRVGELLGLTWPNVDFDENTIRITQTVSRVKNSATGKSSLQFSTPKTEKSKRTIPLLPQAVELLKKHKELQDEQKAEIEEGYAPHNLVFCTELGNPIDPKNYSRSFNAILKAAAIDHINLHALRHTFATRGLENGIELKVMQELLGHSSIMLTADTYSHVLPDKKRKAIDKLKNIF